MILSGPEPQKGILKHKLERVYKEKEPITVILEGRPGDTSESVRSGNIITYNHLSSSDMRKMLTGSNKIIARSGYSTIMDLISLNCSALLIPTPGQTEQIYLAERMMAKNWFYCIEQKDLNLVRDVEIVKNYNGVFLPNSTEKTVKFIWDKFIVSN